MTATPTIPLSYEFTVTPEEEQVISEFCSEMHCDRHKAAMLLFRWGLEMWRLRRELEDTEEAILNKIRGSSSS
ncbi:MAG: hypothetical protein NVS9B14_06560 [Candidatus Acidiferrum sp.]